MAQPGTIASDMAQAEASVLMFLLVGRQFAVDLDRVQHILEYQAPIRTPRRPPFVEGIMQHKGRYLPVVSLRKRLGVEGPVPLHPAILLLSGITRDSVVGLLVDQVLRVLSLPLENVLTPPPRLLGIRAEFIRGVANAGGRPVVWLDEAKLLTSDEPITLLA
ncbi:MAG: chemotaxis protein CheW [Candidatus Methylomirabilota bacterium]